MSANHQIEWITYDSGSFDEFKEALQTMGLTVIQQENIIDGVTYTHFAKLANAPFNNGIYFRYTPGRTEIIDEQEIQYNSQIDYLISKGIVGGVDGSGNPLDFHMLGIISGQQRHSEYDTYVYKMPYIRTDDGGVIILGLGYYEVTNSTTGHTNIHVGDFLYFLPPYEHDEYYEFGYFGYPGRATSTINFIEVAYSGNNVISILSKSTANYSYEINGDVLIMYPLITIEYYANNNNCIYNVMSNRVFSLLYYENILSETVFGAIFKDLDDNEYFATKRFGVAIKL